MVGAAIEPEPAEAGKTVERIYHILLAMAARQADCRLLGQDVGAKSLKANIFGAVSALLLATTAAHADKATTNYTSITVFGDSLVDAGNFFAASGGTQPPTALGYAAGRFTNGLDYTDLLSMALFGTPTVASLAGGTNFAYGFARTTSTTASPDVPDLPEQFATFSTYLGNGHAVDPNGLYVVTIGANDIFNLPNGFPDADTALRAAANNIAQAVQTLNNLGAQNILITDFPVVGAGLASSVAANSYLTTSLAALTLDSDTTLMRFNMLGFFNQVLTDPASLGLAPVSPTGNCIAAGAQASNCAGYLFFDGTHPTAAIQAAAFRAMNAQFNLVTAVPEPASWMMLIGGFAMAGAAMRTRSRKIAFA